MKKKILTVCAGAVIAPFLLAQSLLAQNYNEQGDAPENVAGAQVFAGDGFIGSISGSLLTATDADLFQIFITNPATFSATTVNAQTGVTLDTQLFLFRLDGRPIYMNDNDPGGLSLQSTLPAGNSLRPTTSGYYLIGISVSGYNPADNINQLLFDNTTPDTTVRGPSANNNGRPLDHWSLDREDSGGNYRINFTSTAIPEPSTWALLTFGAAIAGRAALRRRREHSVRIGS